MNFTSDNTACAAAEILEALARENSGQSPAYGADAATGRVADKLSTLFSRPLSVFPVATGTACNSLALATLTPPHGVIFCHESAHIHVDECGAPEFFSGGAKLVPLAGEGGKLTPGAVHAAAAHFPRGVVHHSQPAVLSIAQAAECGTVYTVAEVEALGRCARELGLAFHMDGARFANAIARLGCEPASVTWKAGVDILSLGFTKNGALAAEAIVVFDPSRATDLPFRRKRAGHLFSKMRFVSAQIEAMLDGGLWLRLAARANEAASRLAAGLRARGFELEYPTGANEVFVRLPSREALRLLKAAGAQFYEWDLSPAARPLIRLVCSHATTGTDIDSFLAAVEALPGAGTSSSGQSGG